MSTNRRARELARAKAERQRQRRQDRARRQRIVQVTAVVAVLAVVIGGIVWFSLGRGGEQAADGGADGALPTPTELSPPPTPAPTDIPTPTDAPPEPDPTSPTSQPDPDCAPAPEPRPDDISFPAADDVIEPDTDYTLRLATNCGRIVIETLPDAAPITVNSMVFLAEQGYFDLTACHRLTTEGIFVLQCGDPAGNGTGGPGYSIPEENLPVDAEVGYPAGTVAMARTSEPGSGGSQFFIVYEDTVLPPDYTVWGTVTEGLDVVRGIARAGVAPDGTAPRSDGPPAQAIVIEQVRVVATPRA